MYNVQNNKAHSSIALFLLTVLVSTFLIKPIHILVEHHHLPENTHFNSIYTFQSDSEHSDCPICDFEFCSFVSSSKIELQTIPEIFAKNISPKTVDCFTHHTSHNFLLRAPPAL